MVRTCCLSLLAVTLVSVVPDLPAQEAKLDSPLPEALVKAWKKAGADVGWMGVDEQGRLDFRFGKKGMDGEVPAFLFNQWRPGIVGKLPPPTHDFGLFLGFAKMKDVKTGVDVPISDDELKELAGLKSLHSLYLGFSKVTNQGLKELAKVKSLQSLNLGFTQVTDAGLSELDGLKLQSLGLAATEVTDEGLKIVAKWSSLKSLDLNYTKVTNPGLRELAGLKALQSLGLAATKVSNDGMEYLAGLKALQSLDVMETRVTAKGVADLLTALPRLKVSR